MFIYLFPLLLISLVSVTKLGRLSPLFSPLKLFAFLFLLFIYGLPDGLGPDFFTLKDNQALFGEYLFESSKSSWSIFYTLISIVSDQLGLGLAGVNFACTFLLLSGLFVFLQSTKDFWLGLTCAYPAYIVISTINFNRQSAAIGLFLFGLTYLLQNRKVIFSIFLFCASLTHPSSILFAPLFFVSYPLIHRRITKLFLFQIAFVSLVGILSFSYIASGIAANLINFFGTSLDWISYGIWFRMLPILISFSVAFFFRRTLFDDGFTRNVYLVLGFYSICLTFFFLFNSSLSTVSDRLSLYLLPLPIYVLPLLPYALPVTGLSVFQYKLLIVFIVSAYLLGWLYFSPYSQYWIPYSNLLF